jgi:predicted  nucleic acid-binding Zn-ribbon protein
MSFETRKSFLATRFLTATQTVHTLLDQIKMLEEDTNTPIVEKRMQIEKIREEISKVGTEIDSIKKEITLLKQQKYNIN